jgi:hypothetical protein
MTEYICEKCLKSFGNKKDHWEYHVNRKRPCKKIEGILIQFKESQKIQMCDKIDSDTQSEEKDQEVKLNNLECNYCKKCFYKKFNLERHLEKCKIKNEFNIQAKQYNNDNNNTTFNLILEQLKELKKENENLKKQMDKKKYTKTENTAKRDININIVNNNIVNNNLNNNIVNFNNMNYNNIDKKLFVGPIMNTRLFGKEIILKMIENIYINDNLPEYQNIVITDKNRGYVKIYNNGKWKTDNIQIINLVINGIIEHSKTIWDELSQHHINNLQAKQRLNTSKKYIDLCDLDYLDELEDEQANGDANNTSKIKRCKDFREMVFKDTINLFHDNKNILIKPKKIFD